MCIVKCLALVLIYLSLVQSQDRLEVRNIITVAVTSAPDPTGQWTTKVSQDHDNTGESLSSVKVETRTLGCDEPKPNYRVKATIIKPAESQTVSPPDMSLTTTQSTSPYPPTCTCPTTPPPETCPTPPPCPTTPTPKTCPTTPTPKTCPTQPPCPTTPTPKTCPTLPPPPPPPPCCHTTPPLTCRSGYSRITGLAGCYKYHTNAATWPSAKAVCEQDGGYLIILNSEKEASALRDLIYQNYGEVTAGTYTYDSWVGLIESKTTQNQYFTIFGEQLSSTGFTRWFPGQPNHVGVGAHVCFDARDPRGFYDYTASSNVKCPYACEQLSC